MEGGRERVQDGEWERGGVDYQCVKIGCSSVIITLLVTKFSEPVCIYRFFIQYKVPHK